MDQAVPERAGSVRVLKVDHAWTIDKFRAHDECEPGEALVSPTFYLGGSGDLQGNNQQ